MTSFTKRSNKIKNIGFISTRIAGTDGVSLEIKKWSEVLARCGYGCFYFAGKLDRPSQQSFRIEEAYFGNPIIQDIDKDVFGKRIRKQETSKIVQKIKDKLKACLYDFQKKFKIDLIIPENALTIPMNIPLGIAVTEFIAETCVPTIAHHHDFFWERNRFLVNACRDYLNMAFPPDIPSIRHVVINSLSSEQLSTRLGISNTVIPNVLNFAVKPSPLDEYCDDLKERIGLNNDDIFVLQPTRVVPRKWIERSIEIVRSLKLPKPLLVVSHATGDEGSYYYQRILEYAKNLGVKLVAIDHLIAKARGINKKGEKLYTIADVQKCADLITYPSGYEGFGNAFLEAIYYKKPIVINRYSIYVADIEPKGFDVILFEGFVTNHVIERIKSVLEDKERLEKTVEKNYQIAQKHYSFEVLEEKLIHLIQTFS